MCCGDNTDHKLNNRVGVMCDSPLERGVGVCPFAGKHFNLQKLPQFTI
jgi:hypothetical protein